MADTSAKPHLLGHQAELFCWQVVEVKDKPPIKVAIPVQRPVVDISLLLVLLHAWHPAGIKRQVISHRPGAASVYYTVLPQQVLNKTCH